MENKKITFFSAKPYDKEFFNLSNQGRFQLEFLELPLQASTASLAEGVSAVCIFVNDAADEAALTKLKSLGVEILALRCAGFNQVDLLAAKALQIPVVRVPAYSPYAVAEHTVALIMALNRKTHKAYNRVREGNFSIAGLTGFDMFGKTVGLVGLGKIGLCTAKILAGFGCKLLGFDLYPSEEAKAAGVVFTDMKQLLTQSNIISLHCPLTPDNFHLINTETINMMKPGVMIINTSRGKLVDTQALIEGLKSRRISYVGLDVYEEEADLFFEDLSSQIIEDEVFMRLTTFPNVLITSHQAFLTQEALTNIADTTLNNVEAFLLHGEIKNGVSISFS
jgi:D-lactate dehydrogenase